MVTITEFVLKNKDFLNALKLSQNPKELKKLLDDNGPELIFTDRTIQLSIEILRIMTEIDELKDQAIKTLNDIQLPIFKKKRKKGRPRKVTGNVKQEYEKLKESLEKDYYLDNKQRNTQIEIIYRYYKDYRTGIEFLKQGQSIINDRISKILKVLRNYNFDLESDEGKDLDLHVFYLSFFTNTKLAKYILKRKYNISYRTLNDRLK